MAALSARSAEAFPTLAGPACPWHESCTPMDCVNHRRIPTPSELSEV